MKTPTQSVEVESSNVTTLLSEDQKIIHHLTMSPLHFPKNKTYTSVMGFCGQRILKDDFRVSISALKII